MSALAAQSGFPTACALFTAFRSRFHLSPGEWRKQNLEANRTIRINIKTKKQKGIDMRNIKYET